ncbi:MAG: septum site-determining protein MinC [bacterium]|nr:septum site-determining protein MinC [bacterium]
MQEDTVAIKGIKDGLLITLSSTAEWPTITGDLAARIDEQGAFFQGATVTVEFGERPVSKHELSSLKALLDRRGMTLSVVLSDSATTLNAADALDVRTSTAAYTPGRTPNETLAKTPDAINPEEEGTEGVLIRRTVRNGRTVHSQGHVVILGDVNPGAEVVAGGDVIVWGKLRGNVHAGANGDETAVVCALDMTPTQLRIASYITTSPPGKRRRAKPEMAVVRDHQIIVEAWKE